MDGTIRIRTVACFATSIMVAVVCTLLVTQEWSAGAAPGDADSTFVPTAGCRLADTRPAPNTVGLRSAPLAAGGIFEVTVHGANGECTGELAIPADAVGVALNVTAVNATASSNIRIYPANLADVPLLSNLNVTAGAPPTPNKVDVKLSPDGKIRVFNFRGSVNIFIDVVGFYTSSTLEELAAEIQALRAAQPFVVMDHNPSAELIPSDTAKVFASVDVAAPVDGNVTVSYSLYTLDEAASVICQVGRAGDISGLGNQDSPGGLLGGGNFAGSAVFSVGAGQTVTYVLACSDPFDTAGGAFSPTITALFTPAAS